MFCHINYQVDKKLLREYFFNNFSRARHHKTAFSEWPFWFKLFNSPLVVDPVVKDLGLNGLNVLPRFSFQSKNTRLPPHIDIDRIVGVNINLMDEQTPSIHIRGKPYEYECALIDVGSKIHSVEPADYDRLVLKLAFREPWERIYGILKANQMISSSDLDDYESILPEEDKKFVKI
jgi:hypothetical protein